MDSQKFDISSNVNVCLYAGKTCHINQPVGYLVLFTNRAVRRVNRSLQKTFFNKNLVQKQSTLHEHENTSKGHTKITSIFFAVNA